MDWYEVCQRTGGIGRLGNTPCREEIEPSPCGCGAPTIIEWQSGPRKTTYCPITVKLNLAQKEAKCTIRQAVESYRATLMELNGTWDQFDDDGYWQGDEGAEWPLNIPSLPDTDYVIAAAGLGSIWT